jgi:hypothetical protein
MARHQTLGIEVSGRLKDIHAWKVYTTHFVKSDVSSASPCTYIA